MVSPPPANFSFQCKENKTKPKTCKFYLTARKKIFSTPNFIIASTPIDLPRFSWYFTCEKALLFKPSFIWKCVFFQNS